MFRVRVIELCCVSNFLYWYVTGINTRLWDKKRVILFLYTYFKDWNITENMLG